METINVVATLSFTAAQLDKLSSVSPRLKVTQITTRNASDLAAVLPDVHVIYTLYALPQPGEAPQLKWVQLHSAGVDHVLDHPLFLNEEVAFTTTSGIHAVPMAEYALAQILAFAHRLPAMFEDKAVKHWTKDRWARYVPAELRGTTIGIVGYGSIGREIARLAAAFGMHVLALKRDVRQLDEDGFTLPGVGDPSGEIPDRIYPAGALHSFLDECDYVVLTVPLTSETRNLINAEALAHMKPEAVLINIARGEIVDEAALVEALRDGKIKGAALDVFAEEPLPEDSPFWELPNMIVSPHVSGFTPYYDERATDLFAENLRRFIAGEPLLNQVNRVRAY